MKYKTEMGDRVADSFADLMAIYPLLSVRLVEEGEEDGNREIAYRGGELVKPIGGTSSRFEAQGNTKMVWDAKSVFSYNLEVPRGHGLLKLSQGDEAAIEDFVSAFPPKLFSLNFKRIAADATETHVIYEFHVGTNTDAIPPKNGALDGNVNFYTA